jgi:phosphoadenosine phosphosulfate reductase
VVQANRQTLQKYEQQAIAEITTIKNRFPEMPLSVSFSGGKDSLVCLQLTKKLVDTPFHIIFVNTGIEFPETIDYIDQFIEENNYQDIFCRKDIPSETFWKNVEKYGPPGKDYRYCCKILKIGPINELIDDCIGQKTLSIIGQRAYESISRSESNTLWTNPWIPNQLNFTPIQNWTALHVWLYIFQEKLFYNPLYEQGFSRIGCWLCPACNQGTFELIKEGDPTLWNPWENFLEQWRREHHLPKEWLQWGLWRWRELPKKIIDLAAEKGVPLDFQQLAKKKGQ